VALVEITEAVASILWNVVGIIAALLILWALWQIMQVVRNIREYGDDYVGYMRGEIQAAAKKDEIEILHPTLFNKGRSSKFRRVLEAGREKRK
jgi:hypothetical protein